MSDLCSTRVHQPDVPVVPATIQFPAPLVLAYKRHQRGEDSWDGGEIITALTRLATTALTASEGHA